MPDTFLTQPIKDYFDQMQPGDVIDIWKAKRPAQSVWAAKEYIAQGGYLQLSEDLNTITKVNPWE